MTENDMLK